MTKYIAIDGNGGSGKTYLSELLAAELGAKVFHLDEYGDDFKPFIGIPALIEVVRAATDDIVIYEGVGVFDERFASFDAVRVFVRTSEAVRADRAAKRDVPRPGRTAADWEKIFSIWADAESSYYTPALIASADITINNDSSVDITVLAIRIRRLLGKS